MMTSIALDVDWARLAGPLALGRNLVITPGQAVPEPWALAPRLVVEHDTPDTVAELRTHRPASRS